MSKIINFSVTPIVMLRSISTGTLAVAFMASAVLAQQPMWAQCGGIGWTGEILCILTVTAHSTCCEKAERPAFLEQVVKS
jgi:hypothetical protein